MTPPARSAALWLLAAAVAAAALVTLRPFLAAFLWAGILAIGLWPLRARLARSAPGAARLGIPLLLTLLTALALLLPLFLLAFQAAREAGTALALLAESRATGLPAPAWLPGLPLVGPTAAEWWTATLAAPDGAEALLHRLDRAQLLTLGRRLGAELAHGAVLFSATLLLLFFLFRDGDRLGTQLARAATRAFGPRGARLAAGLTASVHGVVDGLVLVGLGVGLILGIAYAIAGVPHPTLLGAGTALAAMVPFGAPILFGLAALLLLAAGKTAAALAIVATGIAVTFVADHFVRPALIGGTTRLPFPLVLLGLLGGVEAFGLLGLFLGPAVMATGVLLWRDFAGEGAPGD